jgi:hypothetical protein
VMRVVSVSSGKVLLSIATEKTIASSRSGADVFRFLDLGTKLLESETGYSVNEPVNYAVRAAIEAGVVEIIYEGETKGLWKFKETAEIEQGGGSSMNSTSGEEVDIQIPKTRPLILSEALEKWPDERLACSTNNLCTPIVRP